MKVEKKKNKQDDEMQSSLADNNQNLLFYNRKKPAKEKMTKLSNSNDYSLFDSKTNDGEKRNK